MKTKLNDTQKANLLFSLTDAFLYAKREIVRELDKMSLDSQKYSSNLKIDNVKLSKDLSKVVLRLWKKAIRESLYAKKNNIK